MGKTAKPIQIEQDVSSPFYLTAQEICAHLRISRPSFVRLVRDGKLGAVRVGGQWRVSRTSLRSYIKKHSTTTRATAA
jgi:excisionase family DNA binding protein